MRWGCEQRLMRSRTARWMVHPEVAARVEAELALTAEDAGTTVERTDPRSLPGHAPFRQSGWTDHMLLRYFLALEHSEGRTILDSCCGLGWGSHLVASVADRVVGIDLDPGAVRFCTERWAGPGVSYVVGSVLELPFADASFDVVLCMEAIEHFDAAGGRRYLGELARVLRPGGVVVGSSSFPERADEAERLCSGNPHHLHVYTRRAMRSLLREVFAPPTLLTRHYFVARCAPGRRR